MTTFLRCLQKGLFHWPSSVEPTAKSREGLIQLDCPVLQKHRATVPCDGPTTPSITVLLLARGPSAVFRLIIPVVINAIKRMPARRTRPHVAQKVLETIKPPVAHRDTSPAVARKGLRGRTYTAMFHLRPRLVFRGTASSVCDHRLYPTLRFLLSSAATCLSASTPQTHTANGLDGSAYTPAFEHRRATLESCELNNGQFPKSFAALVDDEIGHDVLIVTERPSLVIASNKFELLPS